MSLVAQLPNTDLLKKVVDVIKDLCKDVDFDCSARGIQVMSMDSSHVALVQLTVEDSSFTDFRCDRPASLGMNMDSLTKILSAMSPIDSWSSSVRIGRIGTSK